jgi:uncharacterized protein (DUF2267 family)
MDYQDFTGAVQEAVHIPRDEAERAMRAVLRVLGRHISTGEAEDIDAVVETLAVRVSGGEIHDLIAELPAELHPALERGERESRAATPMSADEFLARVAERERVSREEAERHARAVFAALRDVISSKEFADVAAQLSRDYEPLLEASA